VCDTAHVESVLAVQIKAQMQIAQALGEAAADGSVSSLALLKPLSEAGCVVTASNILGIVVEALQSTFARIVAPVSALH
jgi:hypothetical protein